MGLFDFFKPKKTVAEYLKGGISKNNSRDYYGALNDFIKATELDGDCVEAYLNKARTYIVIKNYPLVLANLKIVIDLDPTNIEAYYNRGVAHHNLNFFDYAIDDFSIVIQRIPNYKSAIDFLEKSIMKKAIAEEFKDINENASDFSNVMELDPSYESNLEAKEKQSQSDGNSQNPIVVEWIQTAESIYFDNGNTELHLDTLYTDDRLSVFLNTETSKNANAIVDIIVNLNGGITNFQKEIRNGYELFYVGDKFSISWRYSIVGLIQVDIISRESNLFVEFDNTNVELDANNNNKAKSEHLNTEAYMAISNGNYLEGIVLVKKALEIMPNDSHFLDTLAVGYYYTGDYELAIETSNKCIAIDNNENSQNSEHYTNRAKINLKLNNLENAIEDLKKALELDPDYQEAIQLLESLK